MSEFHDSENSGTVDNRPFYPQSSTNQVQLKSQVFNFFFFVIVDRKNL